VCKAALPNLQSPPPPSLEIAIVDSHHLMSLPSDVALLALGFCVLKGMRGVQSSREDPNRRAASHPRENNLQTLQNSGFQDVISTYSFFP
jgi:hypothetical protein